MLSTFAAMILTPELAYSFGRRNGSTWLKQQKEKNPSLAVRPGAFSLPGCDIKG
jgi:hypothetical protein